MRMKSLIHNTLYYAQNYAWKFIQKTFNSFVGRFLYKFPILAYINLKKNFREEYKSILGGGKYAKFYEDDRPWK